VSVETAEPVKQVVCKSCSGSLFRIR